jgi:exosortase A-associated hydrolase 2
MNAGIHPGQSSMRTMTMSSPSTKGEAFFLKVDHTQRFCIYHPAQMARHAVLYVHPFAEEMNRSRWMAALQARAFAAAGIAVLQIDLQGCGDSCGDFGDARWQNWKQDLQAAHRWLTETTGLPVSLWGCRLGALLALDYGHGASDALGPYILWQPVLDGYTHLTQFLRLRLANQMLASQAGSQSNPSTQALRDQLQRGASLEIAGYELSPELASAIDLVNAIDLVPIGVHVLWLEVGTDPNRLPMAASKNVIAHWQRQQVRIDTYCVTGPSFWNTQEITQCPTLIDKTLTALDQWKPS